MADNGHDSPNIPGAPDTKHAASMPVPSDKNFPYQFNAMGKPSLADPNFSMPGSAQSDPLAIYAEAKARFQAEVAAANAKSAAQYRADMGGARPTFKPAPKRGK